jgi:hypothetical protein
MKKLISLGLVLAVMQLHGCTDYSPGRIHLGTMRFGGVPEEVVIKTGIHFSDTGGIKLDKSLPIRVEHIGSPTLTEYWTAKFKDAGYSIVDNGELLQLSGFIMARGKFNGIDDPVNTGFVDLDKLASAPLEDKQAQKSSRYVLGTGGIFAPGASASLIGASGIDFLLNATGVKGALADAQNKALGLDKDHLKFCMFGCEAQRAKELQPTQNGVIVLEYKGEKRVVSAVSYQPDFDLFGVMGQIEQKVWIY